MGEGGEKERRVERGRGGKEKKREIERFVSISERLQENSCMYFYTLYVCVSSWEIYTIYTIILWCISSHAYLFPNTTCMYCTLPNSYSSL